MNSAPATGDSARPSWRGSYGIDAPHLLPILAIAFAANVASAAVSHTPWPLVGAGAILAAAAIGLHASRRGKFLVWSDVLAELRLDGSEWILDLGCGRGAVLLLAARRLTTGRAVGIDIWSRADQSGNAAPATRRNAEAEGVADRVDLSTANMTTLPFASGSFDVVVSSVAIHNVKRDADRRATIAEIVRVLRPGGRVLLADIWATGQYAACLSELGIRDVRKRGLGWRMWWSGPWLATWLVTGTAPH